MYVVYIVISDEPFHEIQTIIRSSIIEVEDELDKGEERCCLQQMVAQSSNGEVHLHLYEVTTNWWPGRVYERMLREKLREDGCELELVTPVT